MGSNISFEDINPPIPSDNRAGAGAAHPQRCFLSCLVSSRHKVDKDKNPYDGQPAVMSYELLHIAMQTFWEDGQPDAPLKQVFSSGTSHLLYFNVVLRSHFTLLLISMIHWQWDISSADAGGVQRISGHFRDQP